MRKVRMSGSPPLVFLPSGTTPPRKAQVEFWQPEEKLLPYKGLMFRIKLFSDVIFEFALENGRVTALKQRDPSGEYVFVRK